MELDMINRTVKSILWILFVLYLMLLITIIFFKYGFSMSLVLLQETDRLVMSNFIPLKTIIHYCRTSSIDLTIREVLGNIIAFTPMGFLLPFLFNRIKGVVKISIISFIISLFFEVIQLITNLGSFDVDDMILNVLGAIIGFMVYIAVINKFRENIQRSYRRNPHY